MAARSAGYLLAGAFVAAMAAALFPVAAGYGEKEFLAAYTDAKISHHEVRGDVVLSASLPARTHAITLVGVKKGDGTFPTIDGGSAHRGIRFTPEDSTMKIVLKNLQFINLVAPGTEEGGGGALYVKSAEAAVRHCVFKNNRADRGDGGENGDGGAIHFFSVVFEIAHCIFEGNRAGGYGGAISSRSEGQGSIIHSQFNNNHAGERGGAVVRRGGGVSIDKCKFSGNSAAGEEGAGALSCSEASCLISNSQFTRNVATKGQGGGLRIYFSDEGVTTLCKGNTFSGNKATTDRKSDNLYILGDESVDAPGAVRFCDPKPPSHTLINATDGTVLFNTCDGC